MSLMKYRPFTAGLLDRAFNRFLDEFWDNEDLGLMAGFPKIDLRDEKDHYLVEADLPGLTEKDVEVKFENGTLTISSSKKEQKEEKKEDYIIKERKYHSFSRSLRLPTDIDPNSIEASLKNGILKIKLVKKPEAKPKLIEIKKE